jgi:hypothetical protein
MLLYLTPVHDIGWKKENSNLAAPQRRRRTTTIATSI